MTVTPDLEPSTAWAEVIDPGEDERFDRQAAQIVEVQRIKSAQFGVGRTLHRNQRLGLGAVLDIAEGLPAHAAHGLFARPRRHDVLVRLSNGGTDRAKDATPDIRGFAIKVRGVSGAGALGFDTSCQDFLLINHPVFSLPDSSAFVDLVAASSRGRAALARFAIGRRGLRGGLSLLRSMNATLGVPFTGFASETFWSAAPIANGPFAVRVRLVPVAAGPPAATPEWAADVAHRLATGPLA